MRTHRTRILALIAALGTVPVAAAVAQQAAQPPKAPPTLKPSVVAAGENEALPEAKEILAKAIDAMGGRQAFEEIKSVRISATVTAQGRDSQSTLKAILPDKVLVNQSYPNAPIVVTMGRVGDVAWVDAMGRVQPADPKRLAQFLDLATIHRTVLDMEREYETIETVGRESIAGQDCYKLRLAGKKEYAPTEGRGDRFAFFNVETGLLAVIDAPQQKSPQKRAISEYSDWEEFGKIKLFTKIDAKPSQAGTSKVVKLDDLAFNVVKDDAIQLPESLQPAGGNEGSNAP